MLPSVYAKPSCPAADPCYLLRLLHGRHRIACRLLMIPLSQQGMAASQIADLLGYVPSTVAAGFIAINATAPVGWPTGPLLDEPQKVIDPFTLG
jgi:hypothetical protein